MIYRINKLVYILILGVLLKTIFLNNALAQTTSTTLNATQQKDIIAHFSQTLLKHYVVSNKAEQLVEALSQAQIKGEFSSTKSISDFIAQTNKLIQNITHDKHLVLLNAEKFDQMMKMFHGDDVIGKDNKPSPEKHSQPKANNHHNSHSSSETESSSNPLLVVGVSNVSEISRDGLNQTGYLALERFDASTRSVVFIEQVFSTFTESDNIIIDLRNCGGGEAEMVKILSSYFFDKPTHLLNTLIRNKNSEQSIVERWTIPNKLSPYFADKPLKILVSSKSFSAAESFAFGMQVSGRAELVGETTGGGGYTNDFFPLPNNLGASISVGRTYDYRTGKDWQQVGVIPEIKITQDKALHTALADFTKQSGKLEKIKGENKRIYLKIQEFTNAWYAGDHETMKNLISAKFIRIYHDRKGQEIEKLSVEQLIANTAAGKGIRKNKIHYNRIIRDISVNNSKASVNLILRETVHHILLIKKDGEWLISHDDYKDKLQS